MSITVSNSTQPGSFQAPQPGSNAGSVQATTTLRVVDANQLPDANGKTPNVATEFHMTPGGKVIQTGSEIIPPPPHDPNNDEGVGSVFWRGVKTGVAHPVSFFTWASGERDAALEDRENSPEEQRKNWAKGEPYDELLDQIPEVAVAKQTFDRGAAAVDQIRGKTPDPQDISPPAIIGDPHEIMKETPSSVVVVNH